MLISTTPRPFLLPRPTIFQRLYLGPGIASQYNGPESFSNHHWRDFPSAANSDHKTSTQPNRPSTVSSPHFSISLRNIDLFPVLSSLKMHLGLLFPIRRHRITHRRDRYLDTFGPPRAPTLLCPTGRRRNLICVQ